MPTVGTTRFGRPVPRAGVAALVLALSAAMLTGVTRSASAAAAPSWQAVKVGPLSVQPIDGAPNGLAVGLQQDKTITFRVGGVWTPTPLKGQILGVVDKGTAGATTYVAIIDSGDNTKFQIRKAVNSSTLQLIPGPLVDQTWIDDLVIQPKAITSMVDVTATQFKGNGAVVTSAITSTPTAHRTHINGKDFGFGRYLIKADGAIVDSGLAGDVVGLVGTTPIVDLPDSNRVIAAATPIVIGDATIDFADPIPTWTPTASWGWVSEIAVGSDLNDDGDDTGLPLCRIVETGISECLSEDISIPFVPEIWPVGDNAILFTADTGNELFFFARGALAETPLNGTKEQVLTGPKSALVKVQNLGLPLRFRWVRIGLDGPETTPVIDQSGAGSAIDGVSLGDNRYLVNQAEGGTDVNATDLNGDGDKNDVITQLITATSKMSLGVTADITSTRPNPPAATLEPGGAFALAISGTTDLNGDGNKDDVLHVYDNGLINLRLAISDTVSTDIPEFLPGEGTGELAVTVLESLQATDLNGDGDKDDKLGYVIRRAPTVGALQPARLLDTRPVNQVGYSGSKPTPGQVITLPVAGHGGVPASGANAVVLNVTLADATDAGFVTVWGDGTQPDTSNLNVAGEGSTIANLVLAPIGADGAVRIYTSGGGHVIADAVTWFGSAGPYAPVTPTRLLDTRNGGTTGYSGAKPAANAVVEVQITGQAGIGATPGQLVVLNVTADSATDAGFLTVWGSGPQPTTSNVNVATVGQTIPNLVVVPVGADGKVRIFTKSGAHLLADVFGTLSGPTVSSTTPTRILDTRSGPGAVQVGYSGATPAAGATVTLPIGNPGEIKIINVTATNVTAAGFVTVWPDGDRPTTSNLNPEFAGQSVANLVFAPVGADGKIRIYTSNGTDLIGDVFGTIS
jgi:hypothetical protein